MRVRSRLVLGFCGLAMTAPAASTASAQVGMPSYPAPAAAAPSAGGTSMITVQQAPVMPPSTGAMPPAMGAPLAAPAPAMAAHHHHHHHGILGRRHCVECQRARVQATDGVVVPPPPGYPGGVTLAPGETIVSGPVVVSEHVVGSSDPNAPGYAVVGGPEGMPGYAVANGGAPGAEPTPIGVATAGHRAPADPRMAAAMPRPGVAGSYDPAVMPSSVPAAPSPMSGPGHNRPHVIGHLLGLPKLGHHYESYKDRKREQHSAIAYGDPNEKVNELPASVVYERK